MPVSAPDSAADYESLLHFIYIAPVGLAQITADGEFVMLNPASAQLLMPLSNDGNLTNLFTALERIAPDLRSLTASFSAPSGTICDAMRLHLGAGRRGHLDPQMLSLTLLKLDHNRLMAVLTDISDQVKRERLLRQNEAWLNAILVGINDYALVSLDHDGRVDDWNPSIGRVTGFDREAVLGQPYSIFYPEGGTTPEHVLDRLREADANGWTLDDGWRRKADGSRFWGNNLISPLHPPGDLGSLPQSYCLVIRDISDKRDANEIIRKSMECDHLTGIANRRAFYDAAEIEVMRWQRAPRPLSLVLFDADHFKAVNDSHGHAAGDAVLRHFAATLAATFRECDVVARIGGEEFAVLLPSAPLQSAANVAARLLRTVACSTVEFEGIGIKYTVSGGIAAMDADVAGLDTLMKRADRAMYAAKVAGRNRITCWSAA